jgi:hypothetical protein
MSEIIALDPLRVMTEFGMVEGGNNKVLKFIRDVGKFEQMTEILVV